ncbi:hypothetical protein [Nocardioides solisilvae]|uniref:GntT/GntP/DsdX family permease n=1 Tax=Nocardioides solisilvae TaxID=1542435 RepID=UPI0023B848BC|nr:hypothetical protein [Nocardioides solisilvae]
MIALHTAVAIVLAIGLIIRFKVDPVISLIVASLYLGLAGGVGLQGTVEAVATGFGEIMAEVGLLIGFGVLIGSLLQQAGAFRRLVAVLVRVVGATRLPYALSAMLSTVLPSIYVDVQVVLAAPVARSAAPRLGPHGLPLFASALGRASSPATSSSSRAWRRSRSPGCSTSRSACGWSTASCSVRSPRWSPRG